MIKRNKRDNESFIRERTIETMKSNSFLSLGDIVLVSSGNGGYSFYEIFDSSTKPNKIQLGNGKFAVLIEDPKRYTKEQIDEKLANSDTDVSGKLDLKADKTAVEKIKSDLETSINTKANKNTMINVGSGLSGGGTLLNNVTVNLDPLTHEELNELLNINAIPLDFTLASDTDIRNLFNSMALVTDNSYKLSHIDTDQSKLLNLKLLSLFYDFFLQKVNLKDDDLKKFLTDSISTINSNLNLKEDKSKVQQLITSLREEINNSLSNKEDKTQVTTLLNTLEDKLTKAVNLKEDKTVVTKKITDLETKLNKAISLKDDIISVDNKIKPISDSLDSKANKTINIVGSGDLTGGGTLERDVILNHLNTPGHKHIPSGGLINQILKNSADGTAVWGELSLSELSNVSSLNVGAGLKGGGNIKSNVNVNLDPLTSEELRALLSDYIK